MKRLIILSYILLIGCRPSSNEVPDQPLEIEDFFTNYYEEYLALYPWPASRKGLEEYNNQIENVYSSEFYNQKKDFYSRYLELARTIDTQDLSQREALNLKLLEYQCQMELKMLDSAFPSSYQFIRTENTYHHLYGILAGGTIQPFNSVKDYENWLERMDGFMQIWDSSMVKMRKWMITGHVHPKSIISKIIPQFEQLAKRPIEENILFGPVQSFPDSISVEQQERLINLYRQKGNEMLDKLDALVIFLKDEYLPAGRADSGIGELPDGAEYYDLLIQQHTTTEMSADEIFELGMQEVKRIRREMEKVKTAVGYEGDLNSFFEYVREHPDLKPFQDPEEVIANFYTIHERMKPHLDRLFNKKPSTTFEVRRVEAFREASATFQYARAPEDGSRPGIFYVPIPDVRAYNVMQDESTFLHEAIPGHHYQVSLMNESEDFPEFRKALSFNAYVEGWGLYAETLGKELGLYDDPYQYFGALTTDVHRAIRLVVDVGLHVKGWTREEAIEFSLNNEAESEANIIAEVERYMGRPGQALSYKVGQLKIQSLRKQAEEALGDKFDISAFHEAILSTGPVPLEVLENEIEDWINEQTNGS